MRSLTLTLCTCAALVACNQPPEGLQIGIEPAEPVTTDDLMMTVTQQPVDPNNGDNISIEIDWTQDGTPRPEFTTSIVPASATSKGEVWSVSVRASDGKDAGPYVTTIVTVLNAPPTATVELSPSDPKSDSDVIANTTSDDADDDDVTLSYTWTVDGTVAPDVTGDTVPAYKTSHGETWQVSVTPNDGETDGDEVVDSVVIQNVAPVAIDVTLSPTEVYEGTRLVASATGSDHDNDALTWTYTWFVSGGEVRSGAQDWLDGSDFSKGDNVLVEAVANDGFEDSEAVLSPLLVVLNTAPSVAKVQLSPTKASESTTLTCAATGYFDVDGDADRSRFNWIVDGRTIGATSSTLTGADFDKGQIVKCVVTPSDGEGDGVAVTSDSITIGNSPPVLASAAIDPTSADKTATLKVTLGATTDLDGDRVDYRLNWTVNGSSVSTGDTLSGAFKKGDKVGVTVTPNDGDDDGAPVVATPITIKNAPPSLVSVSIGPATAYTNTRISGSSTATDPDADSLSTSWTWKVNGTSTGTTFSSLDSARFKRGDRVQGFATVSDGADTDGPTGSNVVTIKNTPPKPPTIAIDPAKPTNKDDLICDVTRAGTDLDRDRLTYEFDWERDGVPWTGRTSATDYAGDTIASSDTSAGQIWQCFAIATDGVADSAEVSSSKVTIPTGVPTPGSGGMYGVKTGGDPWTVCRADKSTAWISSNKRGIYSFHDICKNLGYKKGAVRWGGTCGNVCGYCGTKGKEFYDRTGTVGNYSPTQVYYTVHWRCSN